jgi:hypothetical protein
MLTRFSNGKALQTNYGRRVHFTPRLRRAKFDSALDQG